MNGSLQRSQRKSFASEHGAERIGAKAPEASRAGEAISSRPSGPRRSSVRMSGAPSIEFHGFTRAEFSPFSKRSNARRNLLCSCRNGLTSEDSYVLVPRGGAMSGRPPPSSPYLSQKVFMPSGVAGVFAKIANRVSIFSG